MPGVSMPDVSGKELRTAKMAAQRQALVNKRLRRQIRRLRRAMNRRVRAERIKCAGKCDRKMPIYVGHTGGRVLSTETRRVYVPGDKKRNRKRWEAVETHKKLMWLPPKLKKVYKFHTKASKNIAKHHAKIHRISNSPLVERSGWRLVA